MLAERQAQIEDKLDRVRNQQEGLIEEREALLASIEASERVSPCSAIVVKGTMVFADPGKLHRAAAKYFTVMVGSLRRKLHRRRPWSKSV